MRPRDFIDKLNPRVTLDVKGIADLGAVETLTRNTCFVFYVDTEADKNNLLGGVRQQVRTGIGIVFGVITSNSGGASTASSTEIEAARRQVQDVLLGWVPPGADGMVTYRRGRLLNFSEQTLWWQDEYEIEDLITPATSGAGL